MIAMPILATSNLARLRGREGKKKIPTLKQPIMSTNLKIAPRLVAQLTRLILPPNPSRYAIAKKDANGSVAYPHINQTLTDREIETSLLSQSGESAPIGIFLLDEGGQAKAACIDIDCPRDAKDLPAAYALAQRLQEIALASNLRAMIEFSGSRGYHVWIFADRPLWANILLKALKNIAAIAGFEAKEIFPNHPTRETKCIKLPGVVNLKTDKRCGFISTSTHDPNKPEVNLEEMVEILATFPPSPAEEIEALAEDTPQQIHNQQQKVEVDGGEIVEKLKAMGAGNHPACIKHLLANGAPLALDYNQSNATLARFVISKRLSEDEGISLATEMATTTSPDHPTSKAYVSDKVSNFKSVLRSMRSREDDYQFHCAYVLANLNGEKPISRGCIGSQCPAYSLPKPDIQPETTSSPLNRFIFDSLRDISNNEKEVCKSQILASMEKKLEENNKQTPKTKHTLSPSEKLKEEEILAYLIQNPGEIAELEDIYSSGFQSLTNQPPGDYLDYLATLPIPTKETIAEYLLEVHSRGVQQEVKGANEEYVRGGLVLPLFRDSIEVIETRSHFGGKEGAVIDEIGDLFDATFESNKLLLPSFSPHLNRIFGGGFMGGRLYVFGAPPASGKSTFCAQLCDYLAVKNYRIVYVSYEMSKVQLFVASLSRISQLNSQIIEAKNSMSSSYSKQIADAISIYTDEIASNLWLIEADIIHTPAKVKAIAKKAKADLVVIDYLQLMQTGDEKLDNSNMEVLRVSRVASDLKRVARSLQIPIIAISDINKEAYLKAIAGKDMDMGALRDSFKIAHAADAILLLQSGAVGKNSDGASIDQLESLKQKYPERQAQYEKMRINYPLNDDLNECWSRIQIIKNRGGMPGDPIFKYSRATHTFGPIDIDVTPSR
jgi:replicative DNA helicase